MHLIQEDGSMMHNLVCKNMSTVNLYLNLLYFLLTKKKKIQGDFFSFRYSDQTFSSPTIQQASKKNHSKNRKKKQEKNINICNSKHLNDLIK